MKSGQIIMTDGWLFGLPVRFAVMLWLLRVKVAMTSTSAALVNACYFTGMGSPFESNVACTSRVQPIVAVIDFPSFGEIKNQDQMLTSSLDLMNDITGRSIR
jgi:hypothetical protein